MLYDAGEIAQIGPDWRLPRYVEAKPDGSRLSGEWITRYIYRLLDQTPSQHIDYAILSHFHGDHMGQVSEQSPMSSTGAYKLTGLTTVGESIPIRTVLDRDWPTYNYPVEQNSPTMQNYRAFLQWHIENKEMQVAQFEPGRNDQITLQHTPKQYPMFEVRNIAANGEVWTGVANVTRAHFPPLDVLEKKDYPDENMCSIAIRLSYGKFDYYTGGDIRGIPLDGAPQWQDVETPVAKALGPVDVSVMNHHGYIDSQNEFFISTLRPQVWILSVWDSAHPSPMVYKRLRSEYLYPGPCDIFTTNMHEANRLVVVGLDQLASDHGHIVVRVEPGGDSYQVIILDDGVEAGKVKSVHGPYVSR